MINKVKVASILAAGALVLGSATPIFAATAEISGNGSSSNSKVNVTQTDTNMVVQNNNANINNTVSSSSNTGGNTANDNTGGSTTINTGDTTARLSVVNRANLNQASVSSCCSSNNSSSLISGNGSSSNNRVNIDSNHSSSVFQDSRANINNNLRSDSNTGRNDASRNTGGDVTVFTGNSISDLGVRNVANSNRVMSTGSGGGSGLLSAEISGNGSHSRNRINIGQDSSSMVVQGNSATVNNTLRSTADTGRNYANDNTGGSVLVDTGSVLQRLTSDTLVNRNSADPLACGCFVDLNALISGNGSNSHNRIRFNSNSNSQVFQDNDAHLNNSLSAGATTGRNDASRNTGGASDVITGVVMADTGVRNTANVNSVGPSLSLPGGWDLSLSFDLGPFWSML